MSYQHDLRIRISTGKWGKPSQLSCLDGNLFDAKNTVNYNKITLNCKHCKTLQHKIVNIKGTPQASFTKSNITNDGLLALEPSRGIKFVVGGFILRQALARKEM